MSPVTQSSGRTRNSLRVRTAARLTSRTTVAALVAAVVLGIIGMHALASQGTPAAPAVAPSTMTGMNAATHEAAMNSGASHDPHDHAGPASGSTRSMADTLHAGSAGHDMTSMMMLCVVMLVAAALTLLVLLAAGILRPLLPATFQPADVRARAVAWVRGTGPPHEWQFSVIRC